MAAVVESTSAVQALSIPVGVAPWKALLSQHIQQASESDPTKPAEFYLATISPDGMPRVRTVCHRGFWRESGIASTYESDCPTFIAAAQSNKGRDIYTAGLDDCRSQRSSGGGAQVEILYRFRDLGIQWRIRGSCWLLSSEDLDHVQRHSTNDQGVHHMRQAIHAYVRKSKEQGDVSLEGKQPGTVTAEAADPEEEATWWSEEIERYAATLDSQQRKDFEKGGLRVGIILPEAVELRDRMKNSKNLWVLSNPKTEQAIHRREWTLGNAWP